MHIGSYLRELIKEKRYSVADMARMVNKSETSVRKDFEKDTIHMGALEAYAKVLSINIYEILSEVWKSEQNPENPKKYDESKLASETVANEDHQKIKPTKKSSNPIDRLTVSLDITGPKKEAILKILLQ